MFALIMCVACDHGQPCNVTRTGFFKENIALVVTEQGPIGRSFYVKGQDLTTNKETVYRGNDMLYYYVGSNLDLQDTLLKRTGTATFIIKKRDMDIVVEYQCQEDSVVTGIVHNVISVDTLSTKRVARLP